MGVRPVCPRAEKDLGPGSENIETASDVVCPKLSSLGVSISALHKSHKFQFRVLCSDPDGASFTLVLASNVGFLGLLGGQYGTADAAARCSHFPHPNSRLPSMSFHHAFGGHQDKQRTPESSPRP